MLTDEKKKIQNKAMKTSFSARKVHSFFKEKPKSNKKLPVIQEVEIVSRPMS